MASTATRAAPERLVSGYHSFGDLTGGAATALDDTITSDSSGGGRDPAFVKNEASAFAAAEHAGPPPPPDGGLTAWLQVLGAFFLNLNTWGLLNTFGIFQSEYSASFLSASTESAISWIGSVQAFLMLVVCVLCGRLLDAGYFYTDISGINYPVLLKRLILSVGILWAARVMGFVMLATLLVPVAIMKPRLPPRRSGPLINAVELRDPAFAVWLFAVFFTFIGIYIPFFHVGEAEAQLSLIAISFFLGFASGSIQAILPADVASIYPDLSMLGTNMGMTMFASGLGLLIGSPVAGAILERQSIAAGRPTYWGALTFAGATVIVGGLLLIVVRVIKVGFAVVKAS
ncbi:hypothetical protein B0H67DRAFT_552354 [Lasiosphaeris hirsuta]|uniref:Uncharacterized protein n=1 Tax=Lasiosphaeris hirsuta TaxID=260670 RepID=A0AA40AQG5_9PEZI|nr:hypothetical protein B0H67DRAFT_552354 [Lasiosphaeris hirsuta]